MAETNDQALLKANERSFSWHERLQALHKAQDSRQIYDLCVVGGGITGAAIARDAAQRGLKVLLVEKNDIASGTSSRSSKLVHGGLRYLTYFKFALVYEAVRERARLWHESPHLVQPLAFLYPTYKKRSPSFLVLDIGLWIYELFAFLGVYKIHRRFLKKGTLKEEPLLNPEGLKGSVKYWDASTNDALLTFANAYDAWLLGADVITRAKLEMVEWSKDYRENAQAPHQLKMADQISGQNFSVRARAVVCAAGPWTDLVLRATGSPSSRMLAPTRGSHIVIKASRLPVKSAIVIQHPQDNRMMFAIPWGDHTVLGTTDLFDDTHPDRTQITGEEIDYILQAGNDYFPGQSFTRADVVSTWTGLRPLLAPQEGESASAVSREDFMTWDERGLLVIAGGKLTTHRHMARNAVHMILSHARRWKAPWSQKPKRFLSSRPLPVLPYSVPTGAPIGETEAGRMSLEDILGVCRTQMVLTLEDLFVRRTEIYYKEPHHGWLLLPKLKAPLCAQMGWNEQRWLTEVDAYKAYLSNAVLGPLGRTLPTVYPSAELS